LSFDKSSKNLSVAKSVQAPIIQVTSKSM